MHDPDCQPPAEDVAAFEAGLHVRVFGSVDRLLGPLESRFHHEIASGRTIDVLNLAKSFSMVAHQLMPGLPSRQSAAPARQPVHRDRRVNPFWTIGPADPPVGARPGHPN